MIAREAIIREASTWIGTRFRHQGAVKGVGCDCIGLIAGVAKNVGIPEAEAFLADKEFRAYGREPQAHLLLAACAKYLDMVKLGDEQIGDIFVMRFRQDPMHFGFLSRRNPDYLLHTWAGVRKVTEHRIDDVWRGRIMACYRFRGL